MITELGLHDVTQIARFECEGGRLEGKSLKREDLQSALTLYYQMRGWDAATSLPTAGKLAELDLSFVGPELGVS